MENKINIAELLKDCPSGMELDCTIVDGLYFDKVTENNEIKCYSKRFYESTSTCNSICFYSDGSYLNHTKAKCVIFPKGKTTWEGFAPPCKFKEGDIISNDMYIAIFYKADRPYTDFKRDVLYYHCWYNRKYNEFKVETDYGIGHIEGYKLASEEEKQKLFDAIKEHGYKWNEETKTLEKLVEPKFKVGDKIKDKNNKIWFVVQVSDKHFSISLIPNAEGYFVPIEDQDEYELVPNKFDITTLKAFESKVLVRDINTHNWIGSFYSHYEPNGKKFYIIGGSYYLQCIPYKGNEHLLDTSNDCDEYYKTW